MVVSKKRKEKKEREREGIVKKDTLTAIKMPVVDKGRSDF